MSCTDNLVDPQHGRKVHVSNRHGLGISCGTKYCRLLSVRARICHPLQHVSRSATALAKRIPGPHARPGELRDGAIESPDQCGDALCTLFGTESRTSQMARPNPLDLTVCPTPDVMAFPLTIVPKLRTCIVHTKRFQDRAWCWVLEPLRMRYTGSCVAHNRRSKCHQKLPLEL